MPRSEQRQQRHENLLAPDDARAAGTVVVGALGGSAAHVSNTCIEINDSLGMTSMGSAVAATVLAERSHVVKLPFGVKVPIKLAPEGVQATMESSGGGKKVW